MNMLPFVSVIVPAYNAEKNISTLIESLLNQDYPKDKLEIIIVDNNSQDQTKEIIKKYPVKLLEENTIQSSYAGRNKGIRNAKGEVLAFTDSDCMASSQWVREGVNKIISEDFDVAGGKVEFVFSDHATSAEIYDSMANMNNEADIKELKAAKTANLFVKASLFEKNGMFPDYCISGGDVIWTRNAVRNGFTLGFAPLAVVNHPARKIIALLAKQYRVGKGIPYVWIAGGLFSGRKNKVMAKEKSLGVILVSYLCKIVMGLSALLSIPKLIWSRRRCCL